MFTRDSKLIYEVYINTETIPDPTGNNWGWAGHFKFQKLKDGSGYVASSSSPPPNFDYYVTPYLDGWKWDLNREGTHLFYFGIKSSKNEYFHRLDGPAVISPYKERFYIRGQEYSEKEYWTFAKKFKPEDVDIALDLLNI